jgi:hypothetical protein
VYNQNLRGSILSNCVSNIFFSAGDNATAEYQSRITGRRIVQKSTVGAVISPNEDRDSQSLSRREEEEKLISASEYLFFKKFECCMILGGQLPSRFAIERIPFPTVHSSVDIRPDISLERAMSEEQEIFALQAPGGDLRYSPAVERSTAAVSVPELSSKPVPEVAKKVEKAKPVQQQGGRGHKPKRSKRHEENQN